MDSFAKSLAVRLSAAGLADAEFVSSTPESPNFGNAEAVFRFGPLSLRFVRDRGQELLDIAFGANPEQFFLLDDVDVGMGWRTMDDVLAKQEPEKLEDVLARLACHATELKDAFTGARERFTRGRIDRAARDRAEAFMKRLRGRT